MHTRTIGEVAELYQLTKRTLHHWDDIGLLSPCTRSWQGHRLYSNDDISRLQTIIIFRTIGMSLKEISALLDSDDYPHNLRPYLHQQRAYVEQQIVSLHAMLGEIDALLSKETPVSETDVNQALAPLCCPPGCCDPATCDDQQCCPPGATADSPCCCADGAKSELPVVEDTHDCCCSSDKKAAE
ncbi:MULTISPECIES: MerR family transcriptional regulator [unclassified Corynebacterium]|uniref:MerR family transcriptional regulator n=1 Tax=unclassified Corynebacterium TaxID=2624378 RepID=UPI002166F901|nr:MULTISPECIES: MerR family transcriptional regulator [unclassified Corynebacterium]MCS4489768.1 MerR family transcriptional regulator [Corynebacterium sp. ES2775-CONJ]MCS4491868.1 MerR family transcriptional regulator [Corynebacterium sp. ES2715-CONJ3]MCS4531973.1 MerR family transcriptional regulator [Corynebacterium sp. ES2730-CONJ]